VISAFKQIQQHLKLYKKCPENGLALFSNVNQLIDIIPPQPIKQFIYLCDKHFHPQSLYDLYKIHDYHGIILISGNNCYMYMITSIDIKLLYKTDISLQSRQKKGGQSAVRISRLAEEKRHLYLKQIIDKVHEVYFDSQKLNVIVKSFCIAGPSEMKTMLINSELLDYRIKPLILHKLTIDTITNETIYKIVDMNIFNNIKLSEDEILCQHIINNIDQYIYGQDEIQKYIDYQNADCLYVHHTITCHYNINKIIINSNDQYSKILCDYGGVILKPFYLIVDYEEI